MLIKLLKDYENCSINQMLNLTYNNISCCYKRIGKVQQALIYLEKALELQNKEKGFQDKYQEEVKQITNDQNTTLTELNLCAIYSQLKNHAKAKSFALIAVQKLEKELDNFQAFLKQITQEKRSDFSHAYNEKISLFAIANYNLGSQHEFLNEFMDAIGRYELALRLVSDNLDAGNSLAVEFRNSIKQAKIRFQSFQMKAPNRTFTNLSKQQLTQQSSVATMGMNNFTHQTTLKSRAHSATGLKKQRPQSAQVNKILSQNSLKKTFKDETIIEEQPIIQETYSPQHQFVRDISQGRKQRPTSSYITRDKKRLNQNSLFGSFSNLRQSHAGPNNHYDETQNDKGFYQSHHQSSGNKLPSSMLGSQNQIRFQTNNYNEKLINICENDDVIEIVEDEGKSEEDEFTHPLSMPRSNCNIQRRFTRPISAKTTASYGSNFRKSNQNLMNKNQSPSSAYQNYQKQQPRQLSYERIYTQDEAKLQQMKHSKQRQSHQSTIGKPPKKNSSQSRGGVPPRDNSQSKNPQFITNTTLSNSRPISAYGLRPQSSKRPGNNNQMSQSFLTQSGFQNGQQLFEIIDQSFNQIDIVDQAVPEDQQFRFKSTTSKNGDLRDLYSRESLIQQEIFYYNNNILPRVMNQLSNTHNERPQIPKMPSSTKSQTRLSTKNRNSDVSNAYKADGIQVAQRNNFSQRRQPHKVSQKSIKLELSENNQINQSSSEIQPIIGQINNSGFFYPQDDRKQFNIRKSTRNSQKPNQLTNKNSERENPYQSLEIIGLRDKRLKLYFSQGDMYKDFFDQGQPISTRREIKRDLEMLENQNISRFYGSTSPNNQSFARIDGMINSQSSNSPLEKSLKFLTTQEFQNNEKDLNKPVYLHDISDSNFISPLMQNQKDQSQNFQLKNSQLQMFNQSLMKLSQREQLNDQTSFANLLNQTQIIYLPGYSISPGLSPLNSTMNLGLNASQIPPSTTSFTQFNSPRTSNNQNNAILETSCFTVSNNNRRSKKPRMLIKKGQVRIRSESWEKKYRYGALFIKAKKELQKIQDLKNAQEIKEIAFIQEEVLYIISIVRIQRWYRRKKDLQALNYKISSKKYSNEYFITQAQKDLQLFRKQQMINSAKFIQRVFRGYQLRKSIKQLVKQNQNIIFKGIISKCLNGNNQYFRLTVIMKQDTKSLELNFFKLASKTQQLLQYNLSDEEQLQLSLKQEIFLQNLIGTKIDFDSDNLLTLAQDSDEKDLKNTVVKIQSVFRGKQARKMFEKNKQRKEEQKQQTGIIAEQSNEKEMNELVNQVVKIQSVFRGVKARKNKHQDNKVEEEQKENQQQNSSELEDKDMQKTALKIQSVFRGQYARKKFKQNIGNNKQKNPEQNHDSHQDHEREKLPEEEIVQECFESLQQVQQIPVDQDKELIYIYQVNYFKEDKSDQQESKVLINLYLNNKKMMVILKSEGHETVSLYLDDFITRYKDSNTVIQSRDDCLKFLREKLPKVTIVKDSNILLIDSKDAVNYHKDQLIQIADNNNDQSNLTQFQNKDLKENNKLKEFVIKDLKFQQGLTQMTVQLYTNPSIQSLNFYFCLDFNPPYIKISDHYLLNPESLKNITGIAIDINNHKSLCEIFEKDLFIRLGLLNSGLSQQEYLDFNTIKDFMSKYCEEKKRDKGMASLKDIVDKTEKIQKAFRRKKQMQTKKEEVTKQIQQLEQEHQIIQEEEQIKKDIKNSNPVPTLSLKKSETQSSKHSLTLFDSKTRFGSLTLIKQRIQISGYQCLLEAKLDYKEDNLIFKATIQESKMQIPFLVLESFQLKGKTLQQLTCEAEEIIQKLEIKDGELKIKNVLNDYSILSSDVIEKRGVQINNRFFIVTIAMEGETLIIDAYEEKTEKRLEIKIKRTSKRQIQNQQSYPSKKEIDRLIERLDITRIELDEDYDEILTLKQ